MTIAERVGRRDHLGRAGAFLASSAGLAGLVLVLATGSMPAAAAGGSDAGTSPAAKPSEPRDEQRLPSFSGRTLDGKSLSTASFSDKRLILFCFNPGIEQSVAYAEVLKRLAPERSRHNFEIAAVALGLDPDDARAFAAKLGLDFPIFDDSHGSIAVRLGLPSPLVLLGVDAEGRIGLGIAVHEQEPPAPAAAVEARVREYLRLPRVAAEGSGQLEQRPKAPLFEARQIGRDGRFRLADLAGKPVVLVLFLPTCSHCQAALRFFKAELARMPEKNRPVLVAASIDSRPYSVESTLKEAKLELVPLLNDADREISAAYGAFAGVPDIVLIDASGRIAYRAMGWAEGRDPKLMRMRLADLAGATVPMLLEQGGFSGNEACAVCHPAETATWTFTDHAVAFDSLVTRSAEREAKCVGCHVVGLGAPGGYSQTLRQPYLENVGCETCHGSGGGHLAAAAKTGAKTTAAGGTDDYRAACERCHDAEHSLGFDYDGFLGKISHTAIAGLDDAQREALIAGRGRPRDLLPTSSEVVGSQACKACHEREYEVWSRSAHARSVESLRKQRKEGDAECLRCHVTGYGRPGGFPEKASVRSEEDLARVGCESCHGPGADHAKNGGKDLAGIVKLGDKCDSCVILQICGACHDDANDPGFPFKVSRAIEAQRHGPARKAASSGPAASH